MTREGTDQPVQILGEKPFTDLIGGPFRSCDSPLERFCPSTEPADYWGWSIYTPSFD